ncbi:GH19118 [Drosophila grimshawi]|uniref:GH19118 n=1 Tax=Drosophila grimshawi TaxID=7222 RepID=B4JIL9_DROGR|nr:GH19118 [Drosophila grimshawi]
MCDNLCDDLETFNPEVEFLKFIKRKPVVQTAKLYENLHKREDIKCPYNFKGYGVEKDTNTMYRTCNSEYGYYAPNAYTIPTRFYPLSQRFSNDVVRFGIETKTLLNALLCDIYGKQELQARRLRRSRRQRNQDKLHRCRRSSEKSPLARMASSLAGNRPALESLDVRQLTDVCAMLKVEILMMGYLLERTLIARDRLKRHQEVLCEFVTAILVVETRKLHSNQSLRAV